MWWRRLSEVQTEHQNGEERGFKWLWTWNGCWFQTGWSEYYKNCWSSGIFMHNHLRVYREGSEKEKISSEQRLCRQKCLVDVRGQRRMNRLVRDDRKAKLTQITTRYNQGMQNTISERTTRQTLKQIGLQQHSLFFCWRLSNRVALQRAPPSGLGGGGGCLYSS